MTVEGTGGSTPPQEGPGSRPSSHSLSRVTRLLLLALPALVVLGLALPSLGYRHLFVDEAETGARALTILESGLPRTREADGDLSLNTGGLELDDGYLHRYTPWGQFYAGAVGLIVGDTLGVSRDAALRLPFITAHALTSSILQLGLTRVGVHPVVATVTALAHALHSGRLLLNRTARYHALIDLLIALATLSLSRVARGSSTTRDRALFGTCLFLLPHVHTLGGAVAGGCLVLLSLVVDLHRAGTLTAFIAGSRLRLFLSTGVMPLGAGLALVALLSRPWQQGAWTKGVHSALGSSLGFMDFTTYALSGAGLLVAVLIWQRRPGLAAGVSCSVGAGALVIAVLDVAYPFSQFRYYAWLGTFVAGAVVVMAGLAGQGVTRLAAVILVMFIGGELAISAGPFHGVKILLDDLSLQEQQARQPLHVALEPIVADATDSAVAIDYVPQYVNWYLPDHRVALVPDPADKTVLNDDLEVWREPVVFPTWDLFHPQRPAGTWHCGNTDRCSFGREPTGDGRYRIRWHDGQMGPEMCVGLVLKADPINHSIFTLMSPAGRSATGRATADLILARRCEAP